LITGKAGDFSFYLTAPSIPPAFRLLGVKYVLLPKPELMDPAQFELVYSHEVAVYRNRDYRERALAVFDYQVDRDPAGILAQVRSGTFDPAARLLLEEEPERIESAGAHASAEAAVHIISYEPDRVAIEASMPRPGFLLLLDTYFPGWSADVNGRATHIYRADYNFRAVSLPAGKSTIRFSYRPRSFVLGIVLAAACLLLLAGAWFWPRKDRGR